MSNSNEFKEIVSFLENNVNENNILGMARFGIVNDNTYGIDAPTLKALSKRYKGNHDLAIELWKYGKRETMILAGLIADKKKATPELMDEWTSCFNSWDVCDSTCFNYFRYLPWAYQKPFEYAAQDYEFVRRTAFSLMAGLAVADKKSGNELFIPYFDLINKYSYDDRNFVIKAINWALRQIGKRNKELLAMAIGVAEELVMSDDRGSIWVGRNALCEFRNPKILARIKD